MSPSNKLDLDRQPTRVSQNTSLVNSLRRPEGDGLVALAIDGANVGVRADELGGRFNYAAAIATLAGSRPWTGTAVILVSWMTDGIARFAHALRGLGLSVIVSLREHVCGKVKRCDDIVLAVEAACMVLDPSVEELVLVSGDGDLAHVCAISHRAGKRVTVAGFEGTISSKLVQAADRVVLLGERHVMSRNGAW